MDSELIIWIVLVAAFAVLELATMAFVALYFALGAVAAAIVAAAGGDFGWQLLAFAVAGLALMAVTRPLLKHRLEAPDVPTNVSAVIGKRGIVTIPIDNDSNTGQIRIGSDFWSARWFEDEATGIIPVDTRVEVFAVEGVTARVRPRADAPSA